MTVSAHLVFSAAPSGSNLVFGAEDSAPSSISDVFAALTLPPLSFSALCVPDLSVSLVASLPPLSIAAEAVYDSRVSRPLAARTLSAQSLALPLSAVAVAASQEDAAPSPAVFFTALDRAVPVELSGISAPIQDAARRAVALLAGVHDADALGASVVAGLDEAARIRRLAATAIDDGVSLFVSTHGAVQDGLRGGRRVHAAVLQRASPLALVCSGRTRRGQAQLMRWGVAMQDAIAPGFGVAPPLPPTPVPCYTPSPQLRFAMLRSTHGNLVFLCDGAVAPVPPGPSATLVIPVRSVYMIINRSTSLVLANTGQPLEATDMRVAIDADSWAWSWSATVPAAYLPILSAEYGGTVDVVATIAGVDFVLSVERIARSRRFGQATLTVSGRSRAAQLASPYAQEKTTANASASTAQQLMASALTENGVSLGWSLDWQITDWLVPGGVWSHYGSPIDACVEIAGAAGAYIQSHRTQQTLRVLPRYPVAPWAWADVTPDIELPESVVTLEGIEYMDKADYNAVFVSGQASGINAHVTRAGSGGNRPAPMVSHPLITHADAGRQRGLSILGDTGRQRLITLSLPVLQETGVIQPGAMIRYVEQGRTHTGIARAVSVSDSFPKATQQVSIESHDF